MITGGSEATVILLTMAGFAWMKALSTRNDSGIRRSTWVAPGREGRGRRT